SICKEDPGNLNAWANLGFVYDTQKRELDAEESVDKVSYLMGVNSGEDCQEETSLLAARCLAEQAYVYPYDVELDSDDNLRERLMSALSLYNKALHYGGHLAMDLASNDAFILNILAKMVFLLGKHDMATGICNMALNVLPDPELNWQAYCTRAKVLHLRHINSMHDMILFI
ncbi:hypothetical protein XENOCAPTIV_019113, partial [Xenoophorus captivus]